jgi:hypothetical protein
VPAIAGGMIFRLMSVASQTGRNRHLAAQISFSFFAGFCGMIPM